MCVSRAISCCQALAVPTRRLQITARGAVPPGSLSLADVIRSWARVPLWPSVSSSVQWNAHSLPAGCTGLGCDAAEGGRGREGMAQTFPHPRTSDGLHLRTEMACPRFRPLPAFTVWGKIKLERFGAEEGPAMLTRWLSDEKATSSLLGYLPRWPCTFWSLGDRSQALGPLWFL